MPKFHLAKKENKFIPADTESQIKANKVSYGEIVQCRSIDKRNYEHHKKFFALIELAFQNLPEEYDSYFPTPEDLRKELIKAAGFYTEHRDFHGNLVKEAESIRFDNMGQERFEKVYDKVLDLVSRMLKSDNPTVERELMEFM